MAFTRTGIYVVGARRTPFCKYGGFLRELPASQAFAAAAKTALQSANIKPSLVDCTIIGNVNFLSQCDGGKTPRYCGTYSGVPLEKPALGVNKTCGSGLQAVINGALEISTGSAKVCLTGGTEIMSSLPLLVRNVRFGSPLGVSQYLEDHIKVQFPDSYTHSIMENMAEKVAKKFNINRHMADEFAYNSYMKWKAASNKDEITSLTVPFQKRDIVVDKDDLTYTDAEWKNFVGEPKTSREVVTSNNSAAPADGAAALVLADENTTLQHNIKPLARVVAYSCVGVDPIDAGIGAVSAIMKLLDVTKSNLDDIDLFEINEIFAPEVIATIKELKLDEHKVNVGGGALAIGNAVGATGARMAVHLVHQLSSRGAKRGIVATSCGGGQGIAIMFESI